MPALNGKRAISLELVEAAARAAMVPDIAGSYDVAQAVQPAKPSAEASVVFWPAAGFGGFVRMFPGR